MLRLYGMGASQPSRAVWWLCLIKELPFELCDVPLQALGPDGPLGKLNPTGQVPTIRDGDFVLYEMPAILGYLCRKHGSEDFYPADVEARASIDQYLHFHHNRTRTVTFELMAPHVVVAFLDHLRHIETSSELGEKAIDPEKLERGQAAASEIFRLIERGYLRGTRFLCTDSPSIADIACYEELGQLRWAKLFDFEAFPKLAGWLDAMAQLPHHDTAHRYNIELGDIQTRANSIARFLTANAAAVDALEAAGIAIATLDGTGHRELAAQLGG